jgi:lysophospholipase L1-like esterase
MNDQRYTVLCYGDSNTWGYAPATGTRYPRDVRWPGVLAAELGESYEVIPEGLNGRTTVWDDPIEEYKNGSRQLIPCIKSHKPLDLVVIMLGTNDLKQRFSLLAEDVARGAALLASKVMASDTGRDGRAPQVLLVAPPPIVDSDVFSAIFVGAVEKSKHLGAAFAAQAEELGCAFLDAGSVATSSLVDGIHLEPESHAALGRAVAARVREMLE